MQLVLRRLDSEETPRQFLSKRWWRTASLRSLRTGVPALAVLPAPSSELSKRSVQLHRVAYLCGPSSPKNTLSSVFSKSRRAARTNKFMRIAERLADLAFPGLRGRASLQRASGPRLSESVGPDTPRH